MQIAHADPHVGKFSLPDDVDRDVARALLAACVVLNEARTECGRGWEFIAASPLFEALHEGEDIPRYRIEMAANCPFDDPEHEARRVDVGPIGFVAVRQYVLIVPPIEVIASVKH